MHPSFGACRPSDTQPGSGPDSEHLTQYPGGSAPAVPGVVYHDVQAALPGEDRRDRRVDRSLVPDIHLEAADVDRLGRGR